MSVKVMFVPPTEKTQIRKFIIGRVVVIVVHDLDITRQQVAAQGVLNDEAMLRDIPQSIAVRMMRRLNEYVTTFFDVTAAFPSTMLAASARAARSNRYAPLQAIVACGPERHAEVLAHLTE
jgi:hypothetical protein